MNTIDIEAELDGLAKYLVGRGLKPADSAVMMACAIGHIIGLNVPADERDAALAKLETAMHGAAGMRRQAH